jgi:hypothetical protein
MLEIWVWIGLHLHGNDLCLWLNYFQCAEYCFHTCTGNEKACLIECTGWKCDHVTHSDHWFNEITVLW